jgi:hypothetical protein
MTLFPERIGERDVAAVLLAISERPNARSGPRPGDLAGEYDQWFDGGAIRIETGVTCFVFANGIEARVGGPMPHLAVVIRFPDGRIVHVEQR